MIIILTIIEFKSEFLLLHHLVNDWILYNLVLSVNQLPSLKNIINILFSFNLVMIPDKPMKRSVDESSWTCYYYFVNRHGCCFLLLLSHLYWPRDQIKLLSVKIWEYHDSIIIYSCSSYSWAFKKKKPIKGLGTNS
jgi:hypothetical protein